ncbi:PREDICTED: substance-P receptor isoform X1 [Nanorana parkeri]|uniref:substance-P receptor isoform X1 n=1 Tax=Nanorana parkeri TaxID=125878 RepID=UPI0008545974|nr:PREDICTED: substance-P receptor isoform X1 [Nanorana parkeri]
MNNISAQNESALNATIGNGTEMNQFIQPPWQIALWAVAYSIMVIVSVVGNIIVMWIILAHKRMRTVTNYFLVNLAFAEASMSAFNTVINFTYAIHNQWYYGLIYCKFHNFFPISAVFTSIYSMTAIALERYMAIIHPLKPRLSATATKIVICVIWSFSFCMAFPMGYYADAIPIQGRDICYLNWPESEGKSKYGQAYQILVFCLIYILPLLVIGCAYTFIGMTLWASEIPGDSSDRYHEQVVAKRKVVKMMIVVVCTFAICWLPFHIFFLLQTIEMNHDQKIYQQLYLAIMWLAMSSTMYNPIIYCCLNDRFRIGFKHVFRWCPFIRAGEYEGLEMKSTRYLQTQSSMYKISRIETTVSSVLNATDEEAEENGKSNKRLSLDLTSNGSSRSVCKTMSDSSSFYSNNLP